MKPNSAIGLTMLVTACTLLLLLLDDSSTVSAATCDDPDLNPRMTRSLVAALVSRLQRLINGVITGDTEGKGYNPLVAGFIRLAFHSCALDVCCSNYTNLTDPGNNAVQPTRNVIEQLWLELQLEPPYRGLSMADLIAVAGVAALEVATGSRRYSTSIRFGRRDHCPGDDPALLGVELPSRTFGSNATLNYFSRKFNFTAKETVIIMGAHALGVLHNFTEERRPVARWWDGNPARLSSVYYQLLAYKNLIQVTRRYAGATPPIMFEWNYPTLQAKRLMLPSDVGLMYAINVYNKTTGAATCVTVPSKACPRATTAAVVEQYARDEPRFLFDFARTFGKLIENNCHNLTDVVDD